MTKDEKITFLSHMDELRKRLMWSAITVAIGAGVSFVFAEQIIDVMKSVSSNVELQAIEPTEMLGTYFKLSFICGTALALPVIIYEGVMFLRPALTKKERRYLYSLLPVSLIAFAGGVVFAYFILLPPAVNFLFDFGSGVATVEWRISNYITMITRMLFAIGLCFELPIVIYFLTRIGILSVEKLSRFRRWAIVLAFLVAAAITPTFDPINQTLVAAPLIVLYEVGILLARIAGRGKKKSD